LAFASLPPGSGVGAVGWNEVAAAQCSPMQKSEGGEQFDMSKLIRTTISLAAGGAALILAGPATALDKVSFGTNWLAEAEHGGFYQALADGTYEQYGLDVTIVQGGPQAANQALLMADRVQFYMQGNLLGAFSAVEQDVPVMEVAAMFQKDPQVLIAHPDVGIEKFEDLAKLPTIFMSADGFTSYFQWMKMAFKGFRDEQYRPYTFNPAPFLADKESAQQGYITSEPYSIEKEGGIKPVLFLLADVGFDTPSTLIEAKAEFVEKNKELVQRFVDASIVGWYNYLYGDNKPANDLIKKDNPEMTDGQIEFTIATMKSFGLVESGLALEKGIGCMTADQINRFYEKVADAGVVKPGLKLDRMYTTEFVCKGVGMGLKN
jgi:NitT/TauT family transport system substrate-binding protein